MFDSKIKELKLDVDMWKLLHIQMMVKLFMAEIAKTVLDSAKAEEIKGTE